MKIQKLQDLFFDELRELYDAEKQLAKALPRMAGAASSPKLRTVFETHLRETEEQVVRLDQIFEQLGEKTTGHSCDAMKGLIKEIDKVAGNMDESPLRDAGLIGAANRVERYQVATYCSARTFAEMLGYDEVAKLLEQTILEEKQLDRKLT